MTIRKVEKRFIDVRNPDHTIKKCEIRKYSMDDPRGQIESLDEVAEIVLPPHLAVITDDTSGGDQDATQNTTVQIEADYHGVICLNGIYVDVTGGTPRLTVEFA